MAISQAMCTSFKKELLEGAHKGVGLGDKFLRHIERCKVLLHLIDLSEDNLLKTYKQIIKELSSYDKTLSSKKEIVFFNKSDLMTEDDVKQKTEEFEKKINKTYDVISVFSKKDMQKVKKLLIKYASR